VARRLCSILCALALLTSMRPAAADELEELERQDEDPRSYIPIVMPPGTGRYSLKDVIITGASAATIITTSLIGASSSHARGGVFIDEDVRSALRLSSEENRRRARDASDAMLNIMTAYPFVVDIAAYTAWYRQSPDVAWNMALVNVETLALTEAIRTVFNAVVSRERPYGRRCVDEDDPPTPGGLSGRSVDCESNSRYYSFFSGHSSQTFASAALSCSHHLNLRLYGGGWPDATSCIAGFALAGATATLRVVGDMHYLSDVVVGAAFGSAMGFLVPWLVLYRERDPAPQSTTDNIRVTVVPVSGGAGVAGVF
jgi:membrane-associated phospholipid phosphatase